MQLAENRLEPVRGRCRESARDFRFSSAEELRAAGQLELPSERLTGAMRLRLPAGSRGREGDGEEVSRGRQGGGEGGEERDGREASAGGRGRSGGKMG